MIKFNDRYSFYRDKYDWRLVESSMGKDKNGNPKMRTRQTYHPNLDSVANTIIDRCAGDCPDMDSLRQLLSRAGSTVADHLKLLESKDE